MALDFQSSRTLSLSKSGRGGALLNDSVTLNPAMMGFQPAASFSGTFNWVNNAQTAAGANSPKRLNASVMDGKNEYVNAGISYTRRPDADFFHIALAKKVHSNISVGASAKRFSTNADGQALMGKSVTGYDGGASVGLIVPTGLTFGIPVQVGVTGDNLINNGANEKLIGPRQLATGIKINIREILMVYGDHVQNFSRNSKSYPGFAGGTELALGANFFARGGMFFDRAKGWSAGGGWVGPRIGISYGYQNQRQLAERNFEHAITLDMFM